MTNAVTDNANIAGISEIAAETMHGDLMAVVIDEVKALPDVWQKLSEDEQDQVIDRVKTRTRDAIEDCVRIIATQGFVRLRAAVESVTVKDGIKAVLKVGQYDPHRHELVDATGSNAVIVLADLDAFLGGTDQVKADPDQQSLVLDAVEKIGKQQIADDDAEAA